MKTVTCLTKGGPEERPMPYEKGPLCVATKKNDGRRAVYTITLTRTGHSVIPNGIYGLKNAKALLERVLPLTDWTNEGFPAMSHLSADQKRALAGNLMRLFREHNK